MALRDRFTQAYFNYIYNPAYDSTTARLAGYRELLSRSLGRLSPGGNERVLCVGVGTGNEVEYLLKESDQAKIVGVDLSRNALRTARKRAFSMGKHIETLVMDARRLVFPDASFDKVVCVHVMDFIDRPDKATDEIFRVLRGGGEFVITYPSNMEGRKLGANLLKRDISHRMSLGQNRLRATLASCAQMAMGIIYLPIMLRTKPAAYSSAALARLLSAFTTEFEIEEYADYCDFIAHGRKLSR